MKGHPIYSPTLNSLSRIGGSDRAMGAPRTLRDKQQMPNESHVLPRLSIGNKLLTGLLPTVSLSLIFYRVWAESYFPCLEHLI
jgi:hypothetical protein